MSRKQAEAQKFVKQRGADTCCTEGGEGRGLIRAVQRGGSDTFCAEGAGSDT